MRTLQGISMLTILMIAGAMPSAFADGRDLPQTRLFQVIMIEAVTTRELPADGIPPSAMKALDDMRSFLPYKGYRFLDSALVRTAQSAATSLKGPGEGEYRVELSVHEPENEGEPDLFFRRFSIAHMPGKETTDPAGAKDRGSGSGSEAPRPRKELIATSFGMDVGETVIVGSSRLNGDGRALVLLVTALP